MEYDNLERIVITYITHKLKDHNCYCDLENSLRVRNNVKQFSQAYDPQYYLIDREMDLFIARLSALLCNTINKLYCKDTDHQLHVIYLLLKRELKLDADIIFPIIKNIIVHIQFSTELYTPDWHILSVKTYEHQHIHQCQTSYELYRLVSDANYFESLGSIGIARSFTQPQSIRQHYRDLIYNLNCANMLYYNLSKEKARPHVQFLKTFIKQLHLDLG